MLIRYTHPIHRNFFLINRVGFGLLGKYSQTQFKDSKLICSENVDQSTFAH